MSITPFDSALFGPLLSDPELARWLDDRAQLSFMLAVEGALARAEASVGVIPEAAAKAITEVADSLEIDPADLAEGPARDGIPVPALVAALRKAVTAPGGLRSEERSVGKAWVSTCSSRASPYHQHPQHTRL